MLDKIIKCKNNKIFNKWSSLRFKSKRMKQSPKKLKVIASTIQDDFIQLLLAVWSTLPQKLQCLSTLITWSIIELNPLTKTNLKPLHQLSNKPMPVPHEERILLSDRRLGIQTQNEPIALRVHHLFGQTKLRKCLHCAN